MVEVEKRGKVLTKPVVKPIVVTELVQMCEKRKTGSGKERVVRLGSRNC
jgi:hypothetical protein